MKISKIHKSFSDRLKEPEALTNPEDYLGPNWQDVINFWLYLDTLSGDEIDKIGHSYRALDGDMRISAKDVAMNAAWVVVGWKVTNAAWGATYDVSDWYIFGYATCELINYHKLLEQDKALVFLPLCLKS